MSYVYFNSGKLKRTLHIHGQKAKIKKGSRECVELLQTKHMYVLPIKILKQGGQELVFYNDVYKLMNHIGRPRWYVKSPVAQDMFWPISSFISCAGVTRRDGDCYLMHRMQPGGWSYPYNSERSM